LEECIGGEGEVGGGEGGKNLLADHPRACVRHALLCLGCRWPYELLGWAASLPPALRASSRRPAKPVAAPDTRTKKPPLRRAGGATQTHSHLRGARTLAEDNSATRVLHSGSHLHAEGAVSLCLTLSFPFLPFPVALRTTHSSSAFFVTPSRPNGNLRGEWWGFSPTERGSSLAGINRGPEKIGNSALSYRRRGATARSVIWCRGGSVIGGGGEAERRGKSSRGGHGGTEGRGVSLAHFFSSRWGPDACNCAGA